MLNWANGPTNLAFAHWGMLNTIALLPIHTTSRDDAVLNALVDFVARERLMPGDRLPTERILAARLKVSRTTVREALTRWEGLELVERRQGSGTYLKAAVSHDMLHLPLTLASGSDFRNLMHTLEIRRGLEAEAAALCALRAGPVELGDIREKLDRMEDSFHAHNGMSAQEDWDFHQAIYRASGNPLFAQIITAMHELFHRLWEHPLGLHDFGRASFPFHRALYDRIAERDADGARAEALKLIASVEADLRQGASNLKLPEQT
jgi:DNA-binding FadR family transcriptional regulator